MGKAAPTGRPFLALTFYFQNSRIGDAICQLPRDDLARKIFIFIVDYLGADAKSLTGRRAGRREKRQLGIAGRTAYDKKTRQIGQKLKPLA
jgi:hypothetical protein